jgi:hypothetical protein
MNCCESLLEDRRLLHSKFKDKSNRYCHSGIFSGRTGSPFESLTSYLTPYEMQALVTTLIEQYTSRDLSYEQDSLKASIGIFNHFFNPDFKNRGGENISRHIWGLHFSCNRLWGEIGDTRINLFWRHKIDDHSTPTRRKAFPSWSWAGWSGAIIFTSTKTRALERNISLELEDGSRVPFEEIVRTCQPSQ